VDDRHIGIQRGHRHEIDARVGALHFPILRIGLREVFAAGRAHGQKRQARRAGRDARDHRKVRILFVLQAPGLHFLPDNAQRSHAGIAAVREDDLLGAAGCYHLIVDQIGCGAGQGEILLALADDLVPGGERNEVCESSSVNHIASVHETIDGFTNDMTLDMLVPSTVTR
jgi:hypothetical protein